MRSAAVTIVAGFLGSGKTTLLRRVVADPVLGPRVAVIVNELGALGLDEELIASARSTATLHIAQLVSGCICCTLKGELSEALRELAAGDPAPEHILIETSGAAQVTEVAFAVQAASLGAPFHAEAVVTVVDAHNARRAWQEHRALFEDQLGKADVVLLNKSDRVLGDERATLESWLRPLAPRAQWLWTNHADVQPALLLGALPLGVDKGARDRSLPVEEARPHDASGHGFTAVTVPAPWPLDRDALERWLEELSASIYRIKGVVDVVDKGARATVLVQAVGDAVEIEELDEESALAGAVRRLIFIGAAPRREELEEGLSRTRAGDGM